MNNSEFALIIHAPPDQCNCFSPSPDERAIIFLANTKRHPEIAFFCHLHFFYEYK